MIVYANNTQIVKHTTTTKETKTYHYHLYYWVESVQGYNVGDGWTYVSELQKFVDGGMKGTSFIDSISGIVNRGCHKPPCAAGPVDGGPERAQNFKNVLKELQMVVAKESPFVVVEEEKLQLMIA
jgi:hypothetical protein